MPTLPLFGASLGPLSAGDVSVSGPGVARRKLSGCWWVPPSQASVASCAYLYEHRLVMAVGSYRWQAERRDVPYFHPKVPPMPLVSVV